MRNASHTLEIWRPEVVNENDGAPITALTRRASVRGTFGYLSARELEEWAGQSVEASVRVPHSTDVTLADSVRVLDSLSGPQTFSVATIRPNRAHIRVMLRRSGSSV